jgi:hypothetical protein
MPKFLETNSFFTWHIFLEVDKTQKLPSKIWQILVDALSKPNGAPTILVYTYL